MAIEMVVANEEICVQRHLSLLPFTPSRKDAYRLSFINIICSHIALMEVGIFQFRMYYQKNLVLLDKMFCLRVIPYLLEKSHVCKFLSKHNCMVIYSYGS